MFGEESGIMRDRRSVLRGLLEAAALCCLASFGDNLIGRPALGANPAASKPPLTPLQKRLAALGALLETTDPDAAERLAAFVHGEAARLGFDARRIEAMGDLCASLLDEARVRGEFRDGHLQSVDGWILARSEAGACVYLHRLIRRSSAVA